MRRRALVADDDPLTLELIASMLEELGCAPEPPLWGA
jgi:CheY-like chemotaxis protein